MAIEKCRRCAITEVSASAAQMKVRGAFTHYLRLNAGFPYTERTEPALAVLGSLVQSSPAAQH